MIWLGGVTDQLVIRDWSGNWIVYRVSRVIPHQEGNLSPRGRFDLSISSTISTVCSICTRHSPCSGQIGRTSTDILCQDASNNLCPSNKLEIPAFPLQGSNFKNGVRFSVQTTSPGSVPCKRCRLLAGEWSPAGSKETTGRVVRVESTKFKDAQKRPDRDWVKVIHFANALDAISKFPRKEAR